MTRCVTPLFILGSIFLLVSHYCLASDSNQLSILIKEGGIAVCDAPCYQKERSCILEAKLLTESVNGGVAKITGRYMKAIGNGYFLVICMRKKNLIDSKPVQSRIFSLRASLTGGDILSISLLQKTTLSPSFMPGITKSFNAQNKSLIIKCSAKYPIDENQNLQLARVLSNGTMLSIPLDPENYEATMDVNSKTVTLLYTHRDLYLRGYFKNRFICFNLDPETLAYKSGMTEPLSYELPMIPTFKIQAFTTDDRAVASLNELDLTKQNYSMICSESSGYPEAKIYWINQNNETIAANKMTLTANNFKGLCCVAKQTLQTGVLIKKSCPYLDPKIFHRDCQSIKERNRQAANGVYQIHPFNDVIVWTVYCDMTTDNEGWIVVQRRVDDSLSFARGWVQYANGFGEIESNYWMGNEKLCQMTNSAKMIIKIDLWDENNEHRYAKYNKFRVTDASDGYRLLIGEYSGNASDAMAYHNNVKFVTLESSYSCSSRNGNTGWWFENCYTANLNGVYFSPGVDNTKGILWKNWKRLTLKKTIMKIKFK